MRGLRSGTLPTHQIVGLGSAAALAHAQGARDAAHARDLANRLKRELEAIPGVSFNDRHPDGVPVTRNGALASIDTALIYRGLMGISLFTRV